MKNEHSKVFLLAAIWRWKNVHQELSQEKSLAKRVSYWFLKEQLNSVLMNYDSS